MKDVAESQSGIRGLVAISWLYFVQGIPYGLQDKFIPIQLRSQGLDYSKISLLKALLIPWLTKAFWAPLIEVCGGQYQWLVISSSFMALASVWGSLTLMDDLYRIGCVLLAMNICSAVQDVSTDGIAIKLLSEDQLGLGNTLQVVLYKIGCLAGGAGMIYIVSATSWSVSYTYLMVVYVITTIWAVNLMPPEEENEQEQCFNVQNEENSFQQEKPMGNDDLYDKKQEDQNKADHDNSCQKNSQIIPKRSSEANQVYDIVKNVLKTPGTFWLCLFLLFYKMGERGAINNFSLFLLDKGMAKDQINFWNSTVCQFLTILGSFYGGYAVSTNDSNIKSIIISNSVKRTICIGLQFIIVCYWDIYISIDVMCKSHLHTASIGVLCYLSYVSGYISTVTFTLMMKSSRTCLDSSQGSHYSLLASVEVAGKLIFSVAAGFVIDYFGQTLSFALFFILSVLPIYIALNMPWKIYTGKQT